MPVAVVPYRPEWTEQYQHEQARLAATLGSMIQKWEHIGSTSVVGLAAKPIIDMMPGFQSLSAFDASNAVELMRGLGYDYRQDLEPMMPYRRYFTLSDGNPEHPRGHRVHVHMVEVDSEFWVRHLAFRNYLRTHPDERDRYGAFKQKIAPHHADTKTYADAKHDFIQEMQAKALIWYHNQARG